MLGVVTITGESFIAQYRLRLADSDADTSLRAQTEIRPGDTQPLDFPEISLTTPQRKAYALGILKVSSGAVRYKKA